MSCRSGRFYGFKYQQATPLGEPILRNVNPRPADEAEETGHGATVFRFSKQEMPREVSWPVSRNETPAKIVFLFCCFIIGVFQLWPYAWCFWLLGSLFHLWLQGNTETRLLHCSLLTAACALLGAASQLPAPPNAAQCALHGCSHSDPALCSVRAYRNGRK